MQPPELAIQPLGLRLDSVHGDLGPNPFLEQLRECRSAGYLPGRLTRRQLGRNPPFQLPAGILGRLPRRRLPLHPPAAVQPHIRSGVEHSPSRTSVILPCSPATAVSGSFDKLVDLEAACRTAGADPSAWIVSPTAWAKPRKLKLGIDFNAGLLGAGTENAVPRLLSIPVVGNAQVPANSVLLIDRTAVIAAASAVEIATSADAYFAGDSIGVRATLRTGHVVPRPERLGKFVMS